MLERVLEPGIFITNLTAINDIDTFDPDTCTAETKFRYEGDCETIVFGRQEAMAS